MLNRIITLVCVLVVSAGMPSLAMAEGQVAQKPLGGLLLPFGGQDLGELVPEQDWESIVMALGGQEGEDFWRPSDREVGFLAFGGQDLGGLVAGPIAPQLSAHQWLLMQYDDGFIAYIHSGEMVYETDAGQQSMTVSRMIVQYNETDLVWFRLDENHAGDLGLSMTSEFEIQSLTDDDESDDGFDENSDPEPFYEEIDDFEETETPPQE